MRADKEGMPIHRAERICLLGEGRGESAAKKGSKKAAVQESSPVE